MSRLGYRQRAILDALPPAGRAVPTGYLVRRTGVPDPRIIDYSLRSLARQGLIVRERHGWWRAA